MRLSILSLVFPLLVPKKLSDPPAIAPDRRLSFPDWQSTHATKITAKTQITIPNAISIAEITSKIIVSKCPQQAKVVMNNRIISQIKWKINSFFVFYKKILKIS